MAWMLMPLVHGRQSKSDLRHVEAESLAGMMPGVMLARSAEPALLARELTYGPSGQGLALEHSSVVPVSARVPGPGRFADASTVASNVGGTEKFVTSFCAWGGSNTRQPPRLRGRDVASPFCHRILPPPPRGTGVGYRHDRKEK